MLKSRALFLAGVAAILPQAGAVQADPAALVERAFAPPSGPMTLTRTVWRNLHDGNAIKVRRTYSVTITPDGDGYLVNGTLVETAVDAPSQVAALADLERRRVETGVFPFRLDRQGQIRAIAAPALPDHPDVAQTGATMVADSALPGGIRQQTRAMLDQVMGAARGGVAWPRDLFNPASNLSTQKRPVSLPGGGEGQVAVLIAVDRDSPGSVPHSVERTVVTSLEGTESVTREQWTMGPR